jgi:hypothetical protein
LDYLHWRPMAKKKRSGGEDHRAGCWYLPINLETPTRELASGLLFVAVAGEHREAGILRKAGIGEG